MPLALERRNLKVALGPGPAGEWDVGLALLAGEAEERLFDGGRPAGQAGSFALFRSGDWLLGAAAVEVGPALESASHRLYLELLDACSGWHLARIWNYVPEINRLDGDRQPGYFAFCRGRSLAFEQRWGAPFGAHLPAASAVGRQEGKLAVIFAARRSRPLHFENPLQMPAYEYPPEHGPRPPSFARATVVADGPGPTVFISGTAAIRGHATVAPHRLAAQLECTWDNLREISRVCGLGKNVGEGRGLERHFKVYVRAAGDQPAVASFLEERLIRGSDRVSYVLADICREPLLVEIEATLRGVSG